MRLEGAVRSFCAAVVAALAGCTGHNPRMSIGAGVRTVSAQYMGERIAKTALPTLDVTYTEEYKKNLDVYAKLSSLYVSDNWGDDLYEDGTGHGSFVSLSAGPRYCFAETKRSRFSAGLGLELYAGEYDINGMAGVYHVDLDQRLWGVGLIPHLVWERELSQNSDTKLVITVGANFTETVTDDRAHVDLDGAIASFELQTSIAN